MKNKFKILIALLTFTFFLVGCGSNSNNEKANKKANEPNNDKIIKVGMDGETPPYTSVDDKGKLIGFEVDVWNEIGRRLGYNIKFERMEFSTLFGLLDDGRLDTVANQIGTTPERKKTYNFSDSYLYEKSVLVSKVDKKINSIKDLNGMTIAVEPASDDGIIVDALEKESKVKLKRTFYDGASIQDVVLGRVDLWIKGQGSAMESIEKIGKNKLKVLAETPVISESAYPFTKTEHGNKLRDLTSKAIQDMKKDGTLKKLSEKHFHVDMTQEIKK